MGNFKENDMSIQQKIEYVIDPKEETPIWTHEVVKEIMRIIGEAIPEEREIATRGNEHLISKDEGFNKCRDEVKHNLGLDRKEG